jgi:hypothetical protein
MALDVKVANADAALGEGPKHASLPNLWCDAPRVPRRGCPTAPLPSCRMECGLDRVSITYC